MRAIKSTREDIDLISLSQSNYVYMIYEMIGIYQEYLQIGNIKDDFSVYYTNHVGTTEYHHINKGTQLISRLLQENNQKESRRNIHRLGRTYKGFPVVLSRKVDKIILVAIEYINSMLPLKEVYIKNLYNGNVDEHLKFQYELLVRYAHQRAKRGKKTPLKDCIDQIDWGGME